MSGKHRELHYRGRTSTCWIYVPTSSSSTNPKIRTAVSTLTFSYCVFIIKFIAFRCSNRRRRPGILSSFGENIHNISHMESNNKLL